MIFKRTDELKPGMRLAKPIYNKNGVLLYDRNTELTFPGINSIKNFGLIGVYILEPAEPLPPLTREDLEFEQKQTVYMFQLREVFDSIQKHKNIDLLSEIVKSINFKYGRLDHRINFNQNLRSSEDFVYKHSISVALLVAMLGHKSQLDEKTQLSLITAALLYDYGLIFIPYHIQQKGGYLDSSDREIIQECLEKGIDFLSPYRDKQPYMQKACALIQYHTYKTNESKRINSPDASIVLLDDILSIAIDFDLATGIRVGEKPDSEIMAMKTFMETPEKYNPEIVDNLAKSIHIVPAGASVDLSTKDKGIVLVENPNDFMRPLLLRLSNNQLYDLSIDRIYSHMKIIDIMKTMDNRIAIDEDTLKQFQTDDRISSIAKKFKEGLYT